MLGVYGIAILAILLALGKLARRYHIGPAWLKQVTLDKFTHY